MSLLEQCGWGCGRRSGGAGFRGHAGLKLPFGALSQGSDLSEPALCRAMSLLGEMAPLLQRGLPGPQEGGRVSSFLGVTSPCSLSRWASGWGGDGRLPLVHCLSLETTGSGGLMEFAQGPRRPNKNKTALGSLALLAFCLPVAFLPHSSVPPFLPILFSSHL